MKKLRLLAMMGLVLGIVVVTWISGCTGQDDTKLKVVTSTSHLEQLVKRIGGDKVDVINIVPPASHPGDFDASPGDIRRLADADLFLWHNWPGELYVNRLIESANNPGLTVIAIEVPGSWMTPPVKIQAVEKVLAALSQVDNENSAAYREGAERYIESVEASETRVKSLLAEVNVAEVKVICAGWQAGFVNWVGLDMVATYGLPTVPTTSDYEKLVEQGIEAGVTLVIDNLHDNPNAGVPIATELGCKRIVLYNFPGVDEKTKTWEDTFEQNINMILEALSR